MANIRCAHCKGRHATVAQVKLCARREMNRKAADAQAEAEARAEFEAEARNERYFEEGSEAFQAALFTENELDRMNHFLSWH